MTATETAKASDAALLFDPSKLKTLKKRETPSVADLLERGPVQQYDPRFLRNAPVQSRSIETLNNMVRIIEALVSHPLIGRDGFTTAMVVEALEIEADVLDQLVKGAEQQIGSPSKPSSRSKKKSIGTMYRYFEDATAMLDYVDPHRVHGLSGVTSS